MALILPNYTTRPGFVLTEAYARIVSVQGGKDDGWFYSVAVYVDEEARIAQRPPMEQIDGRLPWTDAPIYEACYLNLKARYAGAVDSLADNAPPVVAAPDAPDFEA